MTHGTYGPEDWFAPFHQFALAPRLIGLNRESRKLYYLHFMEHWSGDGRLLSEEEAEVLIDNYMIPGNVEGGVAWDRYSLAPHSDSWDVVDDNRSNIPVSVLWGASDPVVPPDGAQRLPQFYSNYTMKILEDCGHFVMLERPDEVLSAAHQLLE